MKREKELYKYRVLKINRDIIIYIAKYRKIRRLKMNNKVIIIGCGNVGMSYAYALLNQRTKVSELVLIDVNQDKVQGEAMDLNHGLAFSPGKIEIKAGNYTDCSDASIICICAGVNQEEGDTRLDLVYKNNAIFKDIIGKIMNTGFNGIFLIATNPVDVMSYITYKESKVDRSKIIGTGTTLDTARLRYLIGHKLKVNPKNVHAYVMGEHGDSEFVSWSNAYIGAKKMNEFLTNDKLHDIANEVKNAAYEIIAKKGATYYAIGMVLVRITNAILDNENTILTVSTYNKEHQIFIGMPAIVNREGIVKTMDIDLIEEEKDLFDKSAIIIKDVIDNIY